MKETRPNPDVILSRIAGQEHKTRRGNLRLFFGMAAGVGKTYAMLKTAHERIREGIDTQIGFVETYGRVETEELLKGIPIIPRKKIEYRGTIQGEMDIDEILKRRPSLVLVDELAHTNISGSRHEKRYQDVIEILDAGIDVYSTMNVQHLESRADIVMLITAVDIRETVPDSVMDLVDQIELIDITPSGLIERLKEGKVYPGRKTEQALQYFFQEGNLNALREISLRVTANKVEHDMKGAPTSEKLLVAVSHSPFSERLIRTARRVVENMEMSWVAVHVDTGTVLNQDDHNQLVKNLNLASEMGADTLTLHGTDIAKVITDYANEHDVIQIIVGRPTGKRIKRLFLNTSHFIEDLIQKNPKIDITVLQQPEIVDKQRSEKGKPKKFNIEWKNYGKAVLGVTAVTILNSFFDDIIGYRAAGFIFLLLVVVLSAFLPFGAVFISATLSALIWNFFFIPPKGTFSINAPEDVMMFVAYFFIALVSGFLTFQLKRNQTILKEREERTRALYEVLRSMTMVKDTEEIVKLALDKIERLFNAECCIILSDGKSLPDYSSYGKLNLTEKEKAVATWSYINGKMAGWSTDTLSLSKVLCVSLKRGENKFGVLAFKPKDDKKLTPDQENILIGIINQVGIVLAKQKYDDDNRQGILLKESEKLHKTILDCVSHELRTPLTAILGAASALQSQIKNGKTGPNIQLLSEEIISASESLNQIFTNLLDMTRLESDAIKLKKEWFDISELVNFAIDHHKKLLSNRKIEVLKTTTSIYVFLDFALMEHAISNILLNAVSYSPKESNVIITAIKREGKLVIEISDKGSGIPENLIPNIFDKFYRLQGTPVGGLGLGLSIAKNIIELHNGKIDVKNNPQGGAIFSIILPYSEPPKEIQEALC